MQPMVVGFSNGRPSKCLETGPISPITAADLLNDRVLPFFEEHDLKLVLTDRIKVVP
jgi:hypothetical protein